MKLNPYKKNDPSYLLGAFVSGGIAGGLSMLMLLPFNVPLTLYTCEVGIPGTIQKNGVGKLGTMQITGVYNAMG